MATTIAAVPCCGIAIRCDVESHDQSPIKHSRGWPEEAESGTPVRTVAPACAAAIAGTGSARGCDPGGCPGERGSSETDSSESGERSG
eukprot:SAG11_NODE_23505_length_387_cov_1.305556_1_plen_87_part_10